MTSTKVEFLMGLEQECLTVCGTPEADTLQAFSKAYAGLAPSLPDASEQGCFNAYGRMYLDLGPHVELASAEAASPTALVALVEQQQWLAAQAVRLIADQGWRLTLANNNHSGLLVRDAPGWGSHSNYLVPQHPSELADRILPMLATCPFGGAGGLIYPTAEWVGCVRSQFMACDLGGGTTQDRALVSTAREEHLTPHRSGRYRLHLILFDGQRSQFALYLRFATTALALQAVTSERNWVAPLPYGSGRGLRKFWAQAMRKLNILARPGEQPRVDPIALDVQQFYLEGARRWADSIADLPRWIPPALDAWQHTLLALRHNDHDWLSRRLDPWIKHALFTAWLEERGVPWSDLPGNRPVSSQLALLDQQYHAFSDPDSIFDQLDRAGLLEHRLVDFLPPGSEPKPFVPRLSTRAEARARFLKEHSCDRSLRMNWDRVVNVDRGLSCSLADPFAREYGLWTALSGNRCAT